MNTYTESEPHQLSEMIGNLHCPHRLKYKVIYDIRYYCPDCGKFIAEDGKTIL